MTTTQSPTSRRFRGTFVQAEHPNWEPALALLGPDLTPWFQWMEEVRLDDGTAVHVYRHTYTRRAIHISADANRSFFFDPDGSPDSEEVALYGEHAPARAIRLTFAGTELPVRGSDLRELHFQLDDACGRALSGRPFTVDPAELDAQRRFEEREAA